MKVRITWAPEEAAKARELERLIREALGRVRVKEDAGEPYRHTYISAK